MIVAGSSWLIVKSRRGELWAPAPAEATANPRAP
jgi:hypothetical protein